MYSIAEISKTFLTDHFVPLYRTFTSEISVTHIEEGDTLLKETVDSVNPMR